jgi:hypothetical protein
MSRRAARIASAIFINVLAGVPLVMTARAETVPAEDCLLNPKGETPPGSHWRYHIDHVNKRNCWYLRREDGSVAQAAPQPSQAPQPQPAPPPQPAAKPSFADAHAELRPQATVRGDIAAPAPPASAPNPANSAGSNSSPTNSSVWSATAAVATRWPDVPAAASQTPAAPPPAPADDVTPPSADPARAVIPTVPFTNLSLSVQPELILTLIAASMGALVFAGLAALVARSYRKRVRRRKATATQAPIWETTDDDRIVLSDYPAMDDRDYRPRFARGVPSAASRYRAPEIVKQRAPRRARR